MSIAKKVHDSMLRSSWIRRMFEEGVRMKQQFGADKVLDFSLGNPDLEPPQAFKTALRETVENLATGAHAYMQNGGYPDVRAAVATSLSKEHQVEISANEVLMTCGAAGALNVIMKTLLDPGDEVITPLPNFAEYDFYVDNHGGVLKKAQSKPDFTMDIDEIAKLVNEKTKAVLINSPNNPSGQIYPLENILELCALLEKKSVQYGRVIYLLADEPYRRIVYDGALVPSVLFNYKNSIVATSYSKDLSIPGERIGFIAISPSCEYKADLISGMTLTNRTLGYVNAPALIQKVIARVQGVCVPVEIYDRRRKVLCDGLAAAGYEFVMPKGAFYLFPKSPLADDTAFVRALQEELILVVPGSGFGCPGYFRISYCVDEEIIKRALPGFAKIMAKFK